MKLPLTWNLPVTISDRLGQKSFGKQRAIIAEDNLLLVLHKAPEPGDRERDAVLFWRKPDGRWECSKGGVALQQLTNHIKEYNSAEEELNQFYKIAKTAEDYFTLLEAITPLQLAIENLHATLQTAREAIPQDRDLIDLRDGAYEIERTLDILYINTKNALDFKVAKETEASTKAAHRLNTLASIFFPLTAISCVFGMNLTSGLESQSILIFWIIFLAGIWLGLVVRQWVLTGTISKLSFSKLAIDLKRGLSD
ncbi:conserved hypothetical protein [Planktothrix sp. PCC 11201]|uniref:CorA family divalent cation transporter n=1 Tax=Planktothrix sp. PCC 11201 TaxID=1729650 RepID=UPI000916CD20|nr:CorA family divalent cation transporter [Planktothrix sp. PCC 11201]SKB11796.1 conserved hypothetical protein [Planktothrix sp. PCC 11201]